VVIGYARACRRVGCLVLGEPAGGVEDGRGLLLAQFAAELGVAVDDYEFDLHL